MDAALITSAALLGLAGAPHCTAMCGAPCTAVSAQGGRAGWLAFHGARIASYALAGGVVAASAGALATLAQASPALRPLWTLLHLAALALGLWLLWHGRQPAWLGSRGLAGARTGPTLAASSSPTSTPAPVNVSALSGPAWATVALPLPGQAMRTAPSRRGVLTAGLAGAAWVAWPCGLLHSALLVAAMTQTAAAGAVAMAGFALASSAGLVWGPWLWRQIGQRAGQRRAEAWAARLAGVMLVAAALFALGHGLWHQVAVYCGWA